MPARRRVRSARSTTRAAARASSDLYERLKDDIERSRQVYDERTPEHIRREHDFFRDELVRILADGRAESLGPMG